ncbi:MAG: HEPN domain-containing protein [Bacteroidota bacterium]|nr:HEPN domain-containing protein [Bacteroidota bacterium]
MHADAIPWIERAEGDYEGAIVLAEKRSKKIAHLPLCQKIDEEFKVLTPYLEALDPYSVEFRYPGEEISSYDVRKAINAVKKVRKFVREKLGLEKQRRLL